MKFLVILFPFLLLFFVSCYDVSRNVNYDPLFASIESSDTTSLVYWPTSERVESNEYYCEFDSIKYIILETSENTIVDQISSIILFEDRFLVVSSSLKMFDFNGKFLYEIGANGKALGEYISLGAVDVDNENNIVVTDRHGEKFIKYSFDGRCIEQWMTTQRKPTTFRFLSDSLVLGAFAGFSTNEPYYRLVWLDKECNIINSSFPNNTGYSDIVGSFFKCDSTHFFFCYPFSDIIYIVDSCSIRPVISTGFYDSKQVSLFFEMRKSIQNPRKYYEYMVSLPNFVNHMELLKCDTKWISNYQIGTQSFVSFIGKVRRDYLRTDASNKTINYSERFVSSHGDWLLGYIDPIAYDYLTDEKVASSFARIEASTGKKYTVEELEDMNPIITMYHVRQD